MIIQQIIALAIILLFIVKIAGLRRKEIIGKNELIFWLSFWIISAIAIVFIKNIDSFLSNLGFSASGINFLFYISVLLLFYFVFRLRLSIAKLDRSLTDLNRELAVNNAKDKYDR